MGDFVGHPFRGNQWEDGQGGTGPEAQHTTVLRGDYGANRARPWSLRAEGFGEVSGTGAGLRPKEAPPVQEDPEGDARLIAAARAEGVDLVPDGDGVPLAQRMRENEPVNRVGEDIGPYAAHSPAAGASWREHPRPELSRKDRKAGMAPYQGPEGVLTESDPVAGLTRAEAHERNLAREAIGRLSGPSKMPCLSWSIPTSECKVGSILSRTPGTGCDICYAKKGMYVFKSTVEAMRRRFDTWKKMPDDQFIDNFSKAVKGEPYFRWFDSGDVQGERMLKQIVEIAKRTPDTQHWMPTKEALVVQKWMNQHPEGFPKNLQVRLSIPLIDKDPSIIPRNRRKLPMAGILRDGASCPASNQGGACGRCRRCWSDNDVTYKKH